MQGDDSAIRLIWNYVEGMPVNRLAGPDGQPIPISNVFINGVQNNNSDTENSQAEKTD